MPDVPPRFKTEFELWIKLPVPDSAVAAITASDAPLVKVPGFVTVNKVPTVKVAMLLVIVPVAVRLGMDKAAMVPPMVFPVPLKVYTPLPAVKVAPVFTVKLPEIATGIITELFHVPVPFTVTSAKVFVPPATLIAKVPETEVAPTTVIL